ncbi:MAG: phosphatase PAP2 family protein [Actinomycetota bacterium]
MAGDRDSIPTRGDGPIAARGVAFERRRVDAAAIVAGGAVFAVCAFIAHDGGVGGPERAVFEAINGLPSSLEPAGNAVQYLGTLAVGPVVVVAALVLRRWRLAGAAALLTGLKLLIERGVWKLVYRERPAITEPNAIVRGGTATTGASFVSGHVILSTGLAWAITPYLHGRWRAAPWVVVVMIAFARIYLGAHNPLDVVGGFALGVAAGGLANLMVGVPVHEPRPRP